MIKVTDLTKAYGDRYAIDHLNFQVEKGEVVGFLGPNGAGKSTTMKIITGFMAPTSGQVEVEGFDVFETPLEVKKRIGYLPELPPVYGDMKVSEYLKFCAEIKGVAIRKLKESVADALAKTSLEDVEGRLIQNLSKGYKQRVGLAQALVSDPEILILDEPTVGLDPTQVVEMRKLIAGLRGNHTIVLSTHILPEVQANCDRIIIINEGKIVTSDTLENISKTESSSCRISITVARQHDKLVDELNKLSVVTTVRLNGKKIEVEMPQSEESVEQLAEKVVSSGAGLLEFKVESSNLEDIFIRLTGDNDAGNEIQQPEAGGAQ
ncbi:MAG: ABC transporter ATP-binding protein [Bdellovibrionales bacterium]|nr:ABC transporter ATP-binding protein [Bdellovibrionales bacterium]